MYFLRSKVSETVGFFQDRSDSLPFLAQFPPTLLQKNSNKPCFQQMEENEKLRRTTMKLRIEKIKWTKPSFFLTSVGLFSSNMVPGAEYVNV
jgi:hypothetical protein